MEDSEDACVTAAICLEVLEVIVQMLHCLHV